MDQLQFFVPGVKEEEKPAPPPVLWCIHCEKYKQPSDVYCVQEESHVYGLYDIHEEDLKCVFMDPSADDVEYGEANFYCRYCGGQVTLSDDYSYEWR